MAKELYINDQLIDLEEKENPIACSFAVNNLAELKDRQGSTTNRFKLPKTKNNLQILGFPDDAGFTQLQPYRSLPAKIVQNGVEIVPVGLAVILSTNKFIEVQILSGLINFFDLIEGKQLQDLDFSDYEHVWDLPTVVASQTNTNGYLYPIIDYGSLEEDLLKVDVRDLRPAVFEHTVIDKIIKATGYTYEGEIFKDVRLKNAILPFCQEKLEHSKKYVDSTVGNNTEAKTQIERQYDERQKSHIVIWDNAIAPSGNFGNNRYYATKIETIKITAEYDISVRDVWKGGTTPSTHVYIIHKSNGQEIQVGSPNVLSPTKEFETQYYPDQKLDATINVKPGDEVFIRATYEPSTSRIRCYIGASALFKVEAVKDNTIYGQSIQLEMVLPKMSQKDYLKSVLQRFGLTCQTDNYRKHLTFKTLDVLYRNKAKAKDWTTKFLNEPSNDTFTFGEYAQINYGRYKKDSGVPNEIGEGFFTIDNTTLKSSKEILTMPFAASVSVQKLLNRTITEIKKIEDPDKSHDFKIKTEQRVLINSLVNGTAIRFYDENGSQDTNYYSIPYFQKPNNPGLGFDELFNVYYRDLKSKMLVKARKSQASVLLNESDIEQLDFFTPIYDANTACYYYLNMVKEYQENKACIVELVKM